jgi:hypothetical protein
MHGLMREGRRKPVLYSTLEFLEFLATLLPVILGVMPQGNQSVPEFGSLSA